MSNGSEKLKQPGFRLVGDQNSIILTRLDEIVGRLAVIERDIGELKVGYSKAIARLDVMGRRLDRLERRVVGAPV
jgi:hypothetical protein